MNRLGALARSVRDRVDPKLASRLISGLLAVFTGGVLITAAWLTPSELGHSTHRQLGLGQCSFLSLTGHPCPMCGATTTFALFAHLRPVAGVLNQPFAALLFLMTVGVFAVSLAEVVQPRARWIRLSVAIEPVEGRLAAGFLLFMAASWAYKIALMWNG